MAGLLVALSWEALCGLLQGGGGAALRPAAWLSQSPAASGVFQAVVGVVLPPLGCGSRAF